MNAAEIYKHKFSSKRTWWVGLAALLVAFCVGYAGVRKGMQEEQNEEVIISNVPYAEYFMTYAPEIGWDWELLAAIAYHESRYNPKAGHKGGPRGIMQLMPKTGRRFGLNDSTILVPEDNIRAGVQYIGHLQQEFHFITDSVEQVKFILASYNAGPGHIQDARRLTRKYGKNANRWANVEEYMGKLSLEQYYTDSVVEHGRFSGRETRRYVHDVMRTAERIRRDEALLHSQDSLPPAASN